DAASAHRRPLSLHDALPIWGGSGALYPQSAIAGLNSLPRSHRFGVRSLQVALRAGSCATGPREPRQVRKEAAVSESSRVPRGCLDRKSTRLNSSHVKISYAV